MDLEELLEKILLLGCCPDDLDEEIRDALSYHQHHPCSVEGCDGTQGCAGEPVMLRAVDSNEKAEQKALMSELKSIGWIK
jgi:hypothetical protein